MNDIKDPAENSIVDLVDDDEYYQYRQSKTQAENATWAIYIFTAVSFLIYLVYALINRNNFSWQFCIMNVVIIIIYYSLGAFSSYKPLTAFIAMISVLVLFFVLEVYLTSQTNIARILIRLILVIYISMRLSAAQQVQSYENKHPK